MAGGVQYVVVEGWRLDRPGEIDERVPTDLVGAAGRPTSRSGELRSRTSASWGGIVSARERAVVVALVMSCSQATPSTPKKRLCRDLHTLQRHKLERHLPIRSPLSSEGVITESDCDEVAFDVAFLDGYLQGLDRGWSAVAEGEERTPILAEPWVGMSIGVSESCAWGTWSRIGPVLEAMRTEIDASLQARLAFCEG